MQTKSAEKYFFFALLLSTLVFTFFIFRPFWVVLVLGISFSVVLHPVYRMFKRWAPNWVASLLTVLIFTIVVCGPLLGIGVLIFNQSQDLYDNVVGAGNVVPFLDTLGETINKALPAGIEFNMQEKMTEFIAYTSSNIAGIFSSTLAAFFSFLLMLLIMFYFLKDGVRWREMLIVLSPLGDKEDQKIIARLGQSINVVIKGTLLIAVVQGMVMGFGLFLFGVPNAALWGVVASVCSLLPTIGTAIVSVPAVIFLFTYGSTGSAIGLIIWSVVAVGMIDNLLSPYIVGGKINIPPLLILFSVLGGIALLGPVGILMGPLTISLLYTLISIYRNEFRQNTQNTPV
jgi:predicted PurR-regulated permease PerM